MDFYYLELFKKLTIQCPPAHYKPKDMFAYRWVFDDITDERNFTPRYFLVPNMVEKTKIDPNLTEREKDNSLCAMLALSFFKSEFCAKARFDDIKDDMGKNAKKAYQRFGTKIAKAYITKQDGVNEEPDDVGHFNHHPCGYSKDTYMYRFKIIANL